MMDAKSGASLSLKLGYRNIFRCLDTTTFEYNRFINQNQNTMNFKTQFPYFFGDSSITFGYSQEKRDLYKDLSEQS